MSPELIPGVDPLPLPAPAWLFHVLLVFTFFLHALFMNLTLGGTILAAIGRALAGDRTDDYRGVLADRLVGINTYGISLTITTGIAPLLFVQMIYQQYFYTATILIGWVWLGFLAMLMAGYYAVYAYKFRGAPKRGSGGAGWLAVAALMFLLITMVHVAVNLIHAQPESWATLADNPWGILADPSFWPRLLHFVLASLGFSALVIAWWAVRQAGTGKEPELNGRIARFAWRWALWTTVAQMLDGFLLLFVLPHEVLLGLMKGGAATLVPLTVGIVLGIGMLMMLSRAGDSGPKPGLVSGVLWTMFLTIAVMSITRHQVRGLYLEPVASGFELTSAPQWGNFTLFAVLLLAGLGVVAFMVKAVLDNRTEGAGAA